MKLPDGSVRDGTEVVVFGGPDYYQAAPPLPLQTSASAAPGCASRRGRPARPARRAPSQALRRGAVRPQKRCRDRSCRGRSASSPAAAPPPRPTSSPRASGAAPGRVGRSPPPVQDRHAAPKIARALSDLAAVPEVEVIVVARGGGSLADLWAFCDENLCRTVALLRVPVISAVGHESDRTCSTTLPPSAARPRPTRSRRPFASTSPPSIGACRRQRPPRRRGGRRGGPGPRPPPSPRVPARSATTPTASSGASTSRSARSALPPPVRSPAAPTRAPAGARPRPQAAGRPACRRRRRHPDRHSRRRPRAPWPRRVVRPRGRPAADCADPRRARARTRPRAGLRDRQRLRRRRRHQRRGGATAAAAARPLQRR